MKKDRTIYWISTGLVAAVMLFSVINFTFLQGYPFPEGAFEHLHLPGYFKIELTIAKIAGIIVLLIPKLPRAIKEFMYAGFAITLISATVAHASMGDPFFPFIIDPPIFLSALVVSFVYYHKLNHQSLTK